ncbi:RagB/SusD family nutrient uptake outer membrane protein [Persicobacter diffluens]|uniref:RagB/SusD family nutrient uptake outer membrane protein n=1 Tax=Persicobacter diffluens TaxID=981 RepID=A0AAN4W349_9BACT|nr:hypothetical protein PEDI_50150 [Persicobacter diffluens]
MKKLKIFFAAVMISMGACDSFLDVPNKTLISQDSYFQTDRDLLRMLSTSYSNLQDVRIYANYYWKQRGLLTNDAFTIETDADLAGNYRFDFSLSSGELRGLWSSHYKGIRRANTVIREVPATVQNPDLVARVKAEARVLRALYYFQLVQQWDFIPLRTPENMDAYAIEQVDIETVYQFLIADLQDLIDQKALPVSYDGSEDYERGRATIWLAKGLLGKIFLFQEKMDQAASLFRDIIDNGDFELTPNAEDIWNVNNRFSKENLFEVLYDRDVGGGNFWFDDGVESSEGTQRNIWLEAMGDIGGYQNLRPTQEFIDTFEEDDFRLTAFIRQLGDTIYYRNPRIVGGSPDDFLSDRVDPVVAKGHSSMPVNAIGNNESFPVMRLADIYLMYAETQVGKNEAEAKRFIDLVRDRAFYNPWRDEVLPHKSTQELVDSGKSLLDVIKEERRKELCFEGHRYNDLRRWGMLTTLVDHISGEQRFIEGRAYYPVPQQEIDKSGGLMTQSPNYTP